MGHRGKGEGSVFQRADGYWVGSIEAGRTANGQRRKARVVRRYKKDVLAALDDLRRQAQEGGVPDRERTVAQYLTWWLDEVKANEVTPGSMREYRIRVNRITPIIGHRRLGKLTAAHVQDLANRLAEEYPRSPSTRGHTLATLRQALRWAVVGGLIPRNPAEGVQGPRGISAPISDDTLKADEIQLILDAAQDDRLRAMWWLALTYGLRLSELTGLRWSDIDWTTKELTVRKGKTAASVRTLPLIDEAERVLWAHHRAAGIVSIDGWVFVTNYGTPLRDKQVYRAWNDLLRRAGIEHRCRNCNTIDTCSTSVRRFHSTRHTAATHLLERGVPLEVVSAILGHANLSITADIYAKVRSDLMRKGLTRTS